MYNSDTSTVQGSAIQKPWKFEQNYVLNSQYNYHKI